MADRADPLTPRPATAGGLAFPLILAAVVLLQAAFLAWYLTVPLPNATNALPPPAEGLNHKVEPIRRWHILAKFVPYFLPRTGWSDSLLGATLQYLSGLENLPERLPVASAGSLLAGAALGLGLLVLKALRLSGRLRWYERLPLAFLLGATGLGVLALGLGRLGWLAPWPARLGFGLLALAGVGLEVLSIRRRLAFSGFGYGRSWGGAVLGLVLLPFLVLMVLGSMLPTIDFDALEYHLQGPKEWYQAGRIAFLPHNVYTTMPFGVEMLHLLGMHVLDDWWYGALAGQFVAMLFAPAAAVLVGVSASRLASPTAGGFAALAYLTTPWIYRLAAVPYVEGPLAAYHAGLIFVLVLMFVGERPAVASRPLIVALWGVAGGLAGGAMACKYPALITAVIPAALLAMAQAARRRSWAIPLAFAAGLGLTVGPWLAKNLIDHGNPVYPLGHGVFGGSPWSPDREAKWSSAHGRAPIRADLFWADLTQVAGRNDWQSPLFGLLVPLALLRPGSRRPAIVLLVYAAYLFATWWLLTHRLDRFWVPMLPALAVLAGLGADWTTRRAWTLVRGPIVGLGVLSCLVFNTTDLAALSFWTESYERLRTLVPAQASYPLDWIDKTLPDDARVLLIGQAGVFHVRKAILYNTVFDDEIFETIARDQPPAEVARSLRERGVTHVLVDWSEIARHRKPGGYGYTDFVQPEVFAQLVEAGVLAPIRGPGPSQQVFRVL